MSSYGRIEAAERRHGLITVRKHDVQEAVDRMLADRVARSTVSCEVAGLAVVYGRAIEREELGASPTAKVRLPTTRNRRERRADAKEAAALIAALPESDRAVWATACYAGLRRGELQARSAGTTLT